MLFLKNTKQVNELGIPLTSDTLTSLSQKEDP